MMHTWFVTGIAKFPSVYTIMFVKTVYLLVKTTLYGSSNVAIKEIVQPTVKI